MSSTSGASRGAARGDGRGAAGVAVGAAAAGDGAAARPRADAASGQARQGLGGEPQMAPAAAARSGGAGWAHTAAGRAGHLRAAGALRPPRPAGGGPGHAPARPRSGGSSAGVRLLLTLRSLSPLRNTRWRMQELDESLASPTDVQ